MKTLDWLDSETLRDLRTAGVDTTGLNLSEVRALRISEFEAPLQNKCLSMEEIKPLLHVKPLKPFKQLGQLRPSARERNEFSNERQYGQEEDLAAFLRRYGIAPIQGAGEMGLAQPVGPTLTNLRPFCDDRPSKDLKFFKKDTQEKPFDWRRREIPDFRVSRDETRREYLSPEYIIREIKPKDKFSDKPLRSKIPSLDSFREISTTTPESILAKYLEGNPLGLAIASYVQALGLNPFRYTGMQDGRVAFAARRLVTSPSFVKAEARAVAQEKSTKTDFYHAAWERYTLKVVPALAGLTSTTAINLGFKTILNLEPHESPRDILATVREQVDRVNFCKKQVRGILEQRTIQSAYANAVAVKAEQVGTGEYKP